MDAKKFIEDSLTESSETKLKIKKNLQNEILDAVQALNDCFKNGNKLLLCGNGGSAADCQHIATELMIRLSHHIQRPALPAIALTTDTSNLTAGGNDIGFENVFAPSSRQEWWLTASSWRQLLVYEYSCNFHFRKFSEHYKSNSFCPQQRNESSWFFRWQWR